MHRFAKSKAAETLRHQLDERIEVYANGINDYLCQNQKWMNNNRSKEIQIKSESDSKDHLYAAALAGLDAMYYVSFDPKAYEGYCGDHVFLMRSMVVASRGKIREIARVYFEELVVRWITEMQHRIGNPDWIQDSMEAMHVIHQLRSPTSILYKCLNGERKNESKVNSTAYSDFNSGDNMINWNVKEQLFDSNEQRVMQRGTEGFCFGRPRLHNILAWEEIQRKNDCGGDDSAVSLSPDDSEVCRRKRQGTSPSPTDETGSTQRDSRSKRRRPNRRTSEDQYGLFRYVISMFFILSCVTFVTFGVHSVAEEGKSDSRTDRTVKFHSKYTVTLIWFFVNRKPFKLDLVRWKLTGRECAEQYQR